MGRKAIDLSGQQFGKLRAIERQGSDKNSKPLWLCQCECGKVCSKASARLVSGKTRSCGCLRSTSHGMSRHPLYGVWCSMIQRCHNPNTRSYKYYGAKGVEVCDSWRESSREFLEWAMWKWETGLTLDRVDDQAGYCPENCRFITLRDNVLRKRVTGCNVGNIYGTWRVTGRVPETTKLSVMCVECDVADAFEQSNVTQLTCRQCKCRS